MNQGKKREPASQSDSPRLGPRQTAITVRRKTALLVFASITAIAALTVRWWLPTLGTLLGFLEDNSGTIGVLADVISILQVLGFFAAIGLGYLGLRRPRKRTREELATPESSRDPRVGAGVVSKSPSSKPSGLDPEFVQQAQQRLAGLPLDEMPDVGNLPPGSVPGPSPYPHFVGRYDGLKELARILRAGGIAAIGQRPIAAATGLGGIGKTQLASEFVYRYGSYFEGGVFWMDFSTRELVPNEVASCGGVGAMDLRADFHYLPIEEQTKLVKEAWRSPLPRLLVFDNCDDEELLREWQPHPGGCRLLITSRKTDWDPTFEVSPLPLDVFSRPESISLLREHRPDAPPDDPALDSIAEELGDLPLAVDLAGRYLKYYDDATPEIYLDELRRERLEHESMSLDQGISPTGHVMNVRLTFKLHYNRLDKKERVDRRARKLLTKLRLLASGHPIPRELVDATLGSFKPSVSEQRLTTRALKRLTDLGLIALMEGSGDPWIHRLVAEAMSELGESKRARSDVEEAVGRVSASWADYRSTRTFLSLVPHLQALTESVGDREDRRTHGLCRLLGVALYRNGEYDQARPYWERAFEIAESIFGPTKEATLQDLENLGVLVKVEEDIDRALDIYTQVLEAHKQNRRYWRVLENPKKASENEARTFSSVHLNLGSAKRDKAVALEDIQMLRSVREDYELALRIREQALGKHIDTAESLHNMGALELDLKHHDIEQGHTCEPRRYLVCSRDMYSELLGHTNPKLLGPLIKLGIVDAEAGDPGAARPSFEWALEICEREYGPEHCETLEVKAWLGILNDNAN